MRRDRRRKKVTDVEGRRRWTKKKKKNGAKGYGREHKGGRVVGKGRGRNKVGLETRKRER